MNPGGSSVDYEKLKQALVSWVVNVGMGSAD